MTIELRHDAQTGQTVEVPYVPPVPAVPDEVTRLQAKRALAAAGLLDLVEPALAGLPDGVREFAQLEWADALTFKRHHPTIALLADLLDLTSAQVDELFTAAAQYG